MPRCKEKEHTKVEQMDITEQYWVQRKKELKNKIKLFKYIGESIKNTFERGWEHLTTLSNKNHMLKHIITEHPGKEIKNIKFVIKIIKTCKTSFERHI